MLGWTASGSRDKLEYDGSCTTQDEGLILPCKHKGPGVESVLLSLDGFE
jgi:hypothetical protein